MGMSQSYGPTDWDESIATIGRALELGVTFLDTADAYGVGHNEVLVGRAIAGRRDEIQLATKTGIDRSAGRDRPVFHGDRGYIKRSCETSLLRLGVDVIDLYYLHRPPQNAEIEEAVGAMAELVAEGKVRYLGLSEVDEDLLRRAYAVHPITAVQSEYSVWTRDPETTVVPAMRGLGVRAVAEDKGVAPAQVAIAWVYAQEDRLGVPVVPIPGTKRVRWLEQNVEALDVTLTPADLDRLNPLADQVVGAR